MTNEEREEFLEGISKIDLFKMAEGNPDTKQDVTVREVPIPLDPDVSKDNKLQSNKDPEEKKIEDKRLSCRRQLPLPTVRAAAAVSVS